jgi:hypothetical protein
VQRRNANTSSITDAQGWAGILSAFRKEGSAPIDAVDLLPYPDDVGEGSRRISAKTARMLKQLQQEGKLPEALQAEAFQFLQEAEKINR